MLEKANFYTRISLLGTCLGTLFSGKRVGKDALGNVYYQERRTPKGLRQRRWVRYNGAPEASLVPPEWHGWLHHTHDAPIAADSNLHKPWEKPHLPNETGTDAAYLPPGHIGGSGVRAPATGDYEAWKPE